MPDTANGEAKVERQLFPVRSGGTTKVAPTTVNCDVHAEGVFNREGDQSDAWVVHVFGDDGDGAMLEVELPMSNYGLSDLDPYEGQHRYQQELVGPLEGVLGRTGLNIVVH